MPTVTLVTRHRVQGCAGLICAARIEIAEDAA